MQAFFTKMYGKYQGTKYFFTFSLSSGTAGAITAGLFNSPWNPLSEVASTW